MAFFSYLAAFLLINRLRRLLKNTPLYPKWRTLFSVSLWSTAVIYILAESYLDDMGKTFLGSFILLGTVSFAQKEPNFKPLLSFIKAHYPLIAAGFLAGLVLLFRPAFFDKYDNYFDLVTMGAFVWTFARWATSKKQMEEFKIISQQNVELDRLVAERTAELTKQRNELQETVALLQTTQQQLVQSEKLASLGELTAGIAHEIQNPLNFVNNFSEVSMELVDEMEEELAKGDTGEAIAIAADIKQNLEKIIHHGKRADGIVKGMLQHSRASSSTKELTDINKLADEYLRLAYHGLRAKDKSFNAELITHFGENLPAIGVVPQDIGRVLLNLFNNAFYAVGQKQKMVGADYKPVVEVNTATNKKHLVIKVKDNGNGIPDAIKDKIMQPFFTTKPTGEGTGLGLSLSYDIVVKGHGGTIDLNSKDGDGSEFMITLPLI
jgi:two-component system NtrC family sensor kinase